MPRKPSIIKHTDIFTQWLGGELHTQVVAEYQFHPSRKWRFDYALPQHRIAIEIEGGVWTGGRHIRAQGFLGDMEKYNTAAIMGWRLLRFTPDQQMTTKTLESVRAAIRG